jgi:hypothetical protein
VAAMNRTVSSLVPGSRLGATPNRDNMQIRIITLFGMSRLRKIFRAVASAVALACCAATNEIENAIDSFPKMNAREFRPDEAVRSANILIEAGRESASAAIQSTLSAKRERRAAHAGFDQKLMEEEGEINQKVCCLCRLIFTPTNSSKFLRAPRLGASQFLPYESLTPPDWPDIPFVIFNNVPLSMNLGYAGSGIPERGENYLAYCQANGAFRTQIFPQATCLTASNALNELFSSAMWKALQWKDEGVGWSHAFDENDAKEGLWKQIENIANQKVQRTGTSRSAQETNRTSSAVGHRASVQDVRVDGPRGRL